MNKLSIGIPVYNQVDTIAETIESALNQSSPAMEVVVSENYSTDGTAEIVERYKDRIRIVRPPIHCSMAANWNFCVTSCKGDWVGLCSGDDILLSRYSELMVNATLLDKEAVFIMGGWENRNEITGQVTPKYLLSMNEITRVPKTLEMELLSPKASFAAFCFKKSVFEKIGGFNEKFHLIQDWMFQFDIAKHGSFVKVSQLVAQYRISDRPSSIEQYRSTLYIKDRVFYLNVKIWEALDYGISKQKIITSSKKLFKWLLDFMSQYNATLEDETENTLIEIAKRIGMLNEFNQWKAGKWKPAKQNILLNWFEKYARVLYNTFR